MNIIIVDGGSTDCTFELIKKNSDFLSNWVSEVDKGHLDATNRAIAHSGAKYVFWQCFDDWFENDFLSNAVNPLERNPSADFFYGKINYYNNEGKFSFTQKQDLNYKNKNLMKCLI